MCEVARKIARATGVEFDIVGFDSGTGMPAPVNYRDHPEYYSGGDFPMQEPALLRSLLPKNAELVIGDIRRTVPTFNFSAPLGFISIDVDFYYSTVHALQVLCRRPESYLPSVIIYLDDVTYDGHNDYCGELLAVREFTEKHAFRPITRFNFLRQTRVFQRAIWIEQMFLAHILDHPARKQLDKQGSVVLDNPYLSSQARSGKR